MNYQTQTTFAQDGKKRIAGYNCNWHIAESYLGEKNNRDLTCPKCQAYNQLSYPKAGIYQERTGIFFGPDNCMFTAVPEDIVLTKLGKPEIIKN